MQNPARLLRGFFLTLFLFIAARAYAHDLGASYATIRFTPDAMELQIKIAGESAWYLAQTTVAQGVIFVLEDFEKVGKPLLLKYAATMEEMSIDRTVVAPRTIDVVVRDDNFIFTFTYPRPVTRAALKEIYLKKTAPDYISRVVVVDAKNEPVTSKTLRPTDLIFEFYAPTAPAPEKKKD